MRFLTSVFLCISITASSQSNKLQPVHNTYQPSYFTDSNRAQKIKATQAIINKLYKDHAASYHFPGMAYGVIMDGQLVYAGTAGMANMEKKTSVTTQTDFRIASMTKSFTAMAILQLRDRGKLKLDDPAAQYIPELKGIQYPTGDAPIITIRHLLNHAGGFPQDDPWADRQLAATDQELLNVLTRSPAFSTVPGLYYEYSNLGYALLGRIVTVASGEPYQQYITENVLKPLGMTSTYWEYTKVPADKLAMGHRWVNGAWQTVPLLHDGAYGAMGGLITTMEDFSKYLVFHMSAWPARLGTESPVLKRSSIREMHQPGIIGALNAAYKYPSGRACPTVGGYGFGLRWTKDCEGRIPQYPDPLISGWHVASCFAAGLL